MLEPKSIALSMPGTYSTLNYSQSVIIHLLLFSAAEVCYTATAYWHRELPTGEEMASVSFIKLGSF